MAAFLVYRLVIPLSTLFTKAGYFEIAEGMAGRLTVRQLNDTGPEEATQLCKLCAGGVELGCECAQFLVALCQGHHQLPADLLRLPRPGWVQCHR